MAETWGQQHRRRQVERGTPTSTRRNRSASNSKSGLEKTCGLCKGSGQMPQNRVFGKTGRGNCTRCGGSGQVPA